MIAILGHCTDLMADEVSAAAAGPQAAQILADSWRIVPEVVEMLHVTLAGARNVQIH